MFMGSFHQSRQAGLEMLGVTYSDGSNLALHALPDSVKVGDLKPAGPDGATSDARVTGIRKMYLNTDARVISETPMDYDWLAADFDNAHHEYLQVMAEVGILGLVAYLLFFAFFFYEGARLLAALADPAERLIVIGFLGGVVACLVESLANFPYHRLMPIIVTGFGFMVVYGGHRIFDSFGPIPRRGERGGRAPVAVPELAARTVGGGRPPDPGPPRTARGSPSLSASSRSSTTRCASSRPTSSSSRATCG
jgi:hypothetical protein